MATTLEIFAECDQIEIAALVFSHLSNNIGCYGYVWRDESKGPYLISDFDFCRMIEKKYQLQECTMLQGFNSGSSSYNKQFWMWYLEDCFDPLKFMIMGDDSLSDVQDDAVDSFPALQWSLDDIKQDYPTEAEFNKAIDDGIVGIADGGLYYQGEILKCMEMTLICIELA